MARGRGSTSVLLILVVLLSVGVGAVVVAWWPLTDAFGGSPAASTRRTTATVVRSASCAEPGARDLVELSRDGGTVRIPFDGCGHPEGAKLPVRVPEPPGRDSIARPATSDTGPGSSGAGLDDRLSRVLLVLAVVAGGGYALMLRLARPRRSS